MQQSKDKGLPGQKPAKEKRSDTLIFGVLFLASSVLTIVILSTSRSFSVVAGQDEVGYLAKAYALIGHPIGFASKYSSGNAFIFAPVALITEAFGSQIAGWITLAVLNSALLAASFIFARRATRLLRRISQIGKPPTKIRVSDFEPTWCAVLLYPPILFTAQTTLATIPLTLAVTMHIYYVLKFLAQEGKATLTRVVCVGLIAGLIHPTAVLLGAVSLLLSIPVLAARHLRPSYSFTALVLTVTSPVIGFVVDRVWLLPSLNTKTGGEDTDLAFSSSYGNGAEILGTYFERIAKAPFSIAFYLMMATTIFTYWCLTGYQYLPQARKHSVPTRWRVIWTSLKGALRSFSSQKHRQGWRSKFRNLMEYKVLPNFHIYFNFVVVLAAIMPFVAIRYTTERRRIDDWFYLRYSDPFIFIPLLILISLALKERAKVSRRSVWMFVTVMVAVSVIVDLRLPGPQDDFFYYTNAAFWPFNFGLVNLWQGLSVFLLSGLVALILKVPRSIFLVIVLLLSIGSSVKYRSEQASGHSRRSNLTDIVETLVNDGCVAHDPNVPPESRDLMDRRGLDMFRLERPSYLVLDTPKVRRRVGVTGACNDLVLSYDMATEGLLLARDAFGGQGLFATNVAIDFESEILRRFAGGPGRAQTLGEHTSDECLRRGCFSLLGAQMFSTSSDPGSLDETNFVHGPYANVDTGEWIISISVDVPEPSGLIVSTNWAFQGQRDTRELDLNWSLVDGVWLGESALRIDRPVTLFEVVIFSASATSYGYVQSASLLPQPEAN